MGRCELSTVSFLIGAAAAALKKIVCLGFGSICREPSTLAGGRGGLFGRGRLAAAGAKSDGNMPFSSGCGLFFYDVKLTYLTLSWVYKRLASFELFLVFFFVSS